MKSMGPSATLNGAAHKQCTIQPQANGLIGVMVGDAQKPDRSGPTIKYILQRFSRKS